MKNIALVLVLISILVSCKKEEKQLDTVMYQFEAQSLDGTNPEAMFNVSIENNIEEKYCGFVGYRFTTITNNVYLDVELQKETLINCKIIVNGDVVYNNKDIYDKGKHILY